MDARQMGCNPCTLGAQTGPQTIIVRQVVGEAEQQTVLDIHVVVPPRKPSIEQIIDVLVKNLEINSVDVITDKVIVRGEFEIKAIYVACLPDQPVHAVEIKHYKWSQDIAIPGVLRGMDADASVAIEFVDFDVSTDTRAYKHKYYGGNTDDDEDDNCKHHHHCDDGDSGNGDDDDDDCNRAFDVSVVLKVTARVLTDREVMLNQTVPTNPKG